MKKIIASFLLIATVFTANAQVSITPIPGTKKVNIQNNTQCELKIFVGYTESNLKNVNGNLGPGESASHSLAEYSTLIGLKVFYEAKVAGCVPTNYVPIDPQILPIKFRSVTSKWIDSRTLLVTFDVAEVSGVNVYKVRISRDGINYTERAVVFPETTKADHIYTAKISF